jgi:hypothetical protein
MSTGRSIRVYDYVNQPFDRVRAALLADAKGIFNRATTVASARAENVASALRVKVAGIEIGKEIQIEVLGSFDSERSAAGLKETRIELQWTAAGNAALFPNMKAELALYSLSGTETQLDFTGTYEPPFGPLGIVLDVMVGHRIAEASVHQFIVDVAEQLRRDLAEPTRS